MIELEHLTDAKLLAMALMFGCVRWYQTVPAQGVLFFRLGSWGDPCEVIPCRVNDSGENAGLPILRRRVHGQLLSAVSKELARLQGDLTESEVTP